MIFWYTDNELSHMVAEAVAAKNNIPAIHIRSFSPLADDEHIFYGIHRGCGNAMHVLKHAGLDYLYIDNGYFGAKYVDSKMLKHTDGKYRIVRNGMHQKYVGPMMTKDIEIKKVLLLPPSPYSAYFNNTTIEDWINKTAHDFRDYAISIKSKSDGSLPHYVAAADAVIAFNSIGVLEGVAQGKPVYDTHGIFQNYDTAKPNKFYFYDDVIDFYADKQFTLEEIAAGVVQWDKIGYL